MKLTTRIRNYFKLGVYQYQQANGADYVSIIINDDEVVAPARSALLVMQCAARDLSYTGAVKVIYNEHWQESIPDSYIVFNFTNGCITSLEKFNCPYTIYGQHQIERSLGMAR